MQAGAGLAGLAVYVGIHHRPPAALLSREGLASYAEVAMAARRADRLFGLSQRQRDAITSHMFPLAPVPRNSEAWVLTLADKVVASREVGETVGLHMSRLRRKKRAARRAA